MAEREQAALTASEQLAIDQEVALSQWQAKHRDKLPPGRHELLFVCQHLTANPHEIGGPHDWEIYHALQGFLAKTPWPRVNSKEVAAEVNIRVEGGLSLADAREQVAGFLKMSVEAVKQAHIRHGSAKRDKSR
ncbi:MAG TPA: hypothetical protein VFP43_11450 [Mesorhizobium sp.]|nr:hypothetical protein [Mesorhizobium sp.]